MQALKSDPKWGKVIDWSRVALAGHSLGGYTVLGLGGGWPNWKIGGIKAILALSPYNQPLAVNGDLGSIDVPVMYQGGTRDLGITPSIKKPGGAYEDTSPAYYVEFKGAGHFAWTDIKDQSHESIAYYSIAFLNQYVGGNGTKDALSKKMPDVVTLQSK
jgi:hypothetical protein